MRRELFFNSLLRAIGVVAGRIHAHGARWRPPDAFDRPRLDAASLIGTDARFGPADQWLSPPHRAPIQQIRAVATAHITAAGLGSSGLIHGDFHRGNVVFDGHTAAIDFDDAAFGPPAFDLAVALDGVEAQPALVTALLDGYASTHSLDPTTIAALPALLLACKLRLIAWSHARAASSPQIAGLRAVFVERCRAAFDAFERGTLITGI